jgi:hypothetical protein
MRTRVTSRQNVVRGLHGGTALVLLWALAAPPAHAESDAVSPQHAPVAMRTGTHPDFERLVFDLPPGESGIITQDGGTVTLHFTTNGTPVVPSVVPHNAQSVRAGNGTVSIALAPGVRVRPVRMADRLVVDLLDPNATSASDTQADAAPPPPRPAPPPAAVPRAAAASQNVTLRPAARRAVLPSRPEAVPAAEWPAIHEPTPIPPAPQQETASATAAPPPVPAAAPGAAIAAAALTAATTAATAGGPTATASAAPGTAVPDAAAAPVTPVAAAPLASAAAQSPTASAPAAAASAARAAADDASPPAAALAAALGGGGSMALAAEAVRQDAAAGSAGLPVAGSPGGTSPTGVAAAAAGGEVLRLPFAAQTAAAAFRVGGEAMLVFDERRPVDTARLRDDPVFSGVTVQLLEGGTLLRLPLPAGDSVRLSHTRGSWDIALMPGAADIEPIRPISVDGGLLLPANAPGHVVSVQNPQTGGVLLVGTQGVPGQGIAVARSNPMLTLLPTWQGVVVDPAADALVLRPDKDGFVVSGDAPSRPLPLAPTDADSAAMADAAVLSRRFDFPAVPQSALQWRLRDATMQAAAAPAQSRSHDRLLVAQAMLALGLGVEAQSVLSLAAADDPQAADNPDLIGLSAIAALLAGRLDEADGLDDPRLDATDEMTLWRAVRTAMRAAAGEARHDAARDLLHDGGMAAAAPVFAADMKLLLGYPAPMRARLLPLAAEAMIRGGEAKAAERLLASRPDDPSLTFARAMLAERAAREGGDPGPALALYDQLAQGRDRLIRLRATIAATELRLAKGQIDAPQAAAAMDKLVYAWRGDDRELGVRLRAAALMRQAGEWRRGLALLRETAQAWPSQSAAIHQQLLDMFSDALSDDVAHPLPPLELVTLAEENTDLVPSGDAGRALATRLADRLVALDLPSRAIATLSHLMGATPAGAARAELGRRLAALQMQRQDAAGATATLAASDNADLPSDLTESRGLLQARAQAAAGDVPGALARLAQIGTPTADEQRAALYEAGKDWPGATAALTRYAAATVPAEGPLEAAPARTLLRLAAAAAQAGDEAVLARIRAEDLARMPQGDMAQLFDVLTEPPVRDAADLPRAARETTLARAIPDDVKTLPGAPPGPVATR